MLLIIVGISNLCSIQVAMDLLDVMWTSSASHQLGQHSRAVKRSQCSSPYSPGVCFHGARSHNDSQCDKQLYVPADRHKGWRELVLEQLCHKHHVTIRPTVPLLDTASLSVLPTPTGSSDVRNHTHQSMTPMHAERFHAIRIVPVRRDAQRSPARIIELSGIGAVVEQEGNDGRPAAETCTVQHRLAMRRGCIGIRSTFKAYTGCRVSSPVDKDVQERWEGSAAGNVRRGVVPEGQEHIPPVRQAVDEACAQMRLWNRTLWGIRDQGSHGIFPTATVVIRRRCGNRRGIA